MSIIREALISLKPEEQIVAIIHSADITKLISEKLWDTAAPQHLCMNFEIASLSDFYIMNKQELNVLCIIRLCIRRCGWSLSCLCGCRSGAKLSRKRDGKHFTSRSSRIPTSCLTDMHKQSLSCLFLFLHPSVSVAFTLKYSFFCLAIPWIVLMTDFLIPSYLHGVAVGQIHSF